MRNNASEWVNRIVLIILISVTIFFIGAGLNLGDKIAPEWLQQKIREIRTGQEQTVIGFVFLGVGFITLLLIIERVINRIQIAKLKAQAAEELAQAKITRIEELSKISKLLESLIGQMTHDINHCLAVIRAGIESITAFLEDGSLQVVQDEYVEQELPKMIKDILLALSKLTGIVKVTMDTNIIKSGEPLTMSLASCSLHEKVEESIYWFKSQWNAKSIIIRNEVPIDLTIRVDPDRFPRVIDNLLSNAIKYSPEGTTVTIIAKIRENDVLVKVIDHGVGISSEEQEKIFEFYYVINDPEAKKVSQSDRHGIGLTPCRAFIEARGGKIGVESELRKGSTFWFTIPFKQQGDQEEDQKDNDEEE